MTIPLTDEAKKARTRHLNYVARTAMGIGCVMYQTDGINALDPQLQSKIREKVETFNEFTEGNDPHGENDFGSFEHEGHKVMWKIDYYDRNLEFGSEEPWDAGKTKRVLTIMLSEEY